MAKYLFERENGPLNYPSLGLVAFDGGVAKPS